MKYTEAQTCKTNITETKTRKKTRSVIPTDGLTRNCRQIWNFATDKEANLRVQGVGGGELDYTSQGGNMQGKRKQGGTKRWSRQMRRQKGQSPVNCGQSVRLSG